MPKYIFSEKGVCGNCQCLKINQKNVCREAQSLKPIKNNQRRLYEHTA
jgi:hypothetical protein